MLKPSLCDYSDAYIMWVELEVAALAAGGKNNGKNKIFKNCAK